MGMTQGNFDRATRSARETLLDLATHGTGPMKIDLSEMHKRELLTMLHDLEQVAAAVRLELMSRES